MLFICKEFTKCDNDVIGLDPEIEHLEHTVPHSTDHGLSRGTGLLIVYSLRSLSFQSDALNAILGILKFLRTENDPIGSFWGVPFGRSSRCNRPTDFRLCLYWRTSGSSARRRYGFPSWSPLAWERTGIVFNRDQYPLSATNLPAFWELCDRHYNNLRDSEVSQDLFLTGYIVQPPVEHAEEDGYHWYWLTIPLKNKTVVSGLCWDDPDFEAEDVALVTATFTIDSYSTGRQFTFILVELCGEKYKRKGISEAWVESSADIEEWLGNQVKQNIVLV
jgi:hypothetical protein